jgi:hypothetical protein
VTCDGVLSRFALRVRRILRRLLEVFTGDLEVVLAGDHTAVLHPGADPRNEAGALRELSNLDCRTEETAEILCRRR